LSRPFPSRTSSSSTPFVRVNGKIRAREVRVLGDEGKQLGIMGLGDALNLARANGIDLVEIAPNATPPVCRLVDFGKFRYELAKKEKEARKHQHANRVKEVQLSAKIDPHDLAVKTEHAIDFLCEDMKIKVTLKFRGREMAHTEFGFQVVKQFLAQVAPFGHPDFEPKLIGKGINVMITPLPRNKRAKNPRQSQVGEPQPEPAESIEDSQEADRESESDRSVEPHTPVAMQIVRPPEPKSGEFANNPFAQLDVK
jgi:translation initiation factor IF-3